MQYDQKISQTNRVYKNYKKQDINFRKPYRFSRAKKPQLMLRLFHCGCGGRIRTSDLRVMSPTSYQLLHSASTCFTTSSSHDLVFLMVLVAGLEPARILVRRILSPLRLPVPPHEQDALVVRSIMIARTQVFVKSNF